jgi:Heterokaryon incompatibility protein (HET)
MTDQSTANLIESDPMSEKSISCFQKWLNDCEHTHDSCTKPGPAFKPTRLLDVGTVTSPELKLVLSESQTVSPYAALSHCWGKAQLHTTTIATIAQHLQAIPFSVLPQTFKDAVAVTRRLDLRFLWIDSLCIVQDDEVDWFREAAAMASVYGNAHVTIMASQSSSSEESFLEPRSRPLVIKEETSNVGHKQAFYLVNSKFHDNSIYRATYNIRHTLHKRAWVLQERILSRRKLLFCNDQVFWECKRLATSEDQQIQEALPEQTFSKLNEWFETVEKYTACDITYDKDVLPAMSGIARSFAEATGFSYCAGIWLDRFSDCLLWYPHNAYGKKKKRGLYVAPTFSWASSQGPVRYRGQRASNHTFCDYSTCQQNLPENSEDEFSAITSAAIVLEGPALKVTRLIRHEWGTNLVLKLQSGQRYVIPVDFDHADTNCDPTHTIVLPLYDDESRMQALVLRRASDELSDSMYHRIGISWCPYHELSKMNWWGSIVKPDDDLEQRREFIQQVMHHPREAVILI